MITQLEREAPRGMEQAPTMPDIPELKLEPSDSFKERYEAASSWYLDLCDRVRTVPQEWRFAFGERVRQRLKETTPPQNRFTTNQGSEYYVLSGEGPNGPKIAVRVRGSEAGLLGKIQPPTILLGFVNEEQRNEIRNYAGMIGWGKDKYNGRTLTVNTQERGRTFAFKGIDTQPRVGLMPLEFIAREGRFPRRIGIDPEAGTAVLEYNDVIQPALHVESSVRETNF